eukprot:TRINITY_DN6429_c0_g1_i1.p1 TRINITY_DN6429_c0_g1~~TRINITY_DN6429_c0_g1_i1.p1  ORF type:complete len:220 (+),score=56.31 TRINITY_DN6429_c0_g1_i1:70-729(+)
MSHVESADASVDAQQSIDYGDSIDAVVNEEKEGAIQSDEIDSSANDTQTAENQKHDYSESIESLLIRTAHDYAHVFPTPATNPMLVEQHAVLSGKLSYLQLKMAEQERLRQTMQEEIELVDTVVIPEIRQKVAYLQRAFLMIDRLDEYTKSVLRAVDILEEHISAVERGFQYRSIKKFIPFSKSGSATSGLPPPPEISTIMTNTDEFFKHLRQTLGQNN